MRCATEGCTRLPVKARGLCGACYRYLCIYGTTVRKGRPRQPTPPAERIWPKVDKEGPLPPMRPHLGPCWLWKAGKDKKGYGHFKWSPSQRMQAHRAVWLLLRGPIPDGLQLDHLCLVKECVNPAHLEPVTGPENMRRAAALRTRCKNGLHDWVPENQVKVKDRTLCKPCSDERMARFYRAHPKVPKERPPYDPYEGCCPQGHPYTRENTFLAKRPGGFAKKCKQCRRERRRAEKDRTGVWR